MPTDSLSYSLSVEVDCDPAILKETYNILQSLDMPIFIIQLNVKGRQCYRLCAGIFTNEQEATEWIDRVKTRIASSHPFTFAILQEASESDLRAIEQRYIDANTNGYNLQDALAY